LTITGRKYAGNKRICLFLVFNEIKQHYAIVKVIVCIHLTLVDKHDPVLKVKNINMIITGKTVADAIVFFFGNGGKIIA